MISFLVRGVSPRISNLVLSVAGDVRSEELLEEHERKTVRMRTRRTVGSCDGKSKNSVRRTWIVVVVVTERVLTKSLIKSSTRVLLNIQPTA